MILRHTLLLGCLLAVGLPLAAAESMPQAEGLRLEIIPAQATYEIGQPVPVTLRYTYTGTIPLVFHAPINPCPRRTALEFTAKGPSGKPVADPIDDFMDRMGFTNYPNSHMATYEIMPKVPYDDAQELNQYLVFTQPGRYEIVVTSTVTALSPYRTGASEQTVSVTSAPITITITPAVEAHLQQTLTQAAADLAGKPPRNKEVAALQRLRYLRDSRAIPYLIPALAERDGFITCEAYFGLRIMPDQAAVKTALLQAIDAGKIPQDLFNMGLEAKLLAHADKDQPGALDETAWTQNLTARIEKREAAVPSSSPSDRRAAAITSRYDNFRRPGIPDPTLDQCRFVLQHAGSLREDDDQAPGFIEHWCSRSDLSDDLQAVWRDEKTVRAVRNAALMAFLTIDKTPVQDQIANDLMSPHPVYSAQIHAMIGDYRKDEIGRALLALISNPDGTISYSACERLRAFGQSVSAADLDAALLRLLGEGKLNSTHGGAIYALASKSPERAAALIAKIASTPIAINYLPGEVEYLTIRLKPARPRLKQILAHGTAEERAYTLRGMAEAAQELRQADYHKQHPDPERPLVPNPYQSPLPDPDFLQACVPELLQIAKTEPNNETRFLAISLLAQATHLPADYQNDHYPVTQILPDQIAGLLPQWEEWAKDHPASS